MKKPAFDPIVKMKSFKADLDQSLKAGLEKMRIDPESIHEIHNSFRRVAGQLDFPFPDMKEIHDFIISKENLEIPVRLFVPLNAKPSEGPCLIYFHGGGFVAGDKEDAYDDLLRATLNSLIENTLLSDG